MPGFLESRSAITDLVYRYALNVRNADAAACAELFTEDVEFIVQEVDPRSRSEAIVRSRSIGREQTVDHIGRPFADISLCPLIHNLLIDVNGREGRSTCVMENRTFPAIPGMIGEYHDSYRFEKRWRFSKRIFTMFVDRATTAAE